MQLVKAMTGHDATLSGNTVDGQAVLADEQAGWRPGEFSYELWGCRPGLVFLSVKLLDYRSQWRSLEASGNPLATVVLAQRWSTLLPFVPVMRGGQDRRAVGRALALLRADERLSETEPLLAFFATSVMTPREVLTMMR